MSETPPVDRSIPTEGLVGQPRDIISKYIYNLPTLKKLIIPSQTDHQATTEAAIADIAGLDPADALRVTTGLFSIIGSEEAPVLAGNGQDARDGALALLRLIDFGKVDSNFLLNTYVSRVNSTPQNAEAFGSVYSLLEAGQVIAPHLPINIFSRGPLIEAWNKVIENCTKNIPVPGRREAYLELREMFNTIIEGLPVPAPAPAPVTQPAANTSAEATSLPETAENLAPEPVTTAQEKQNLKTKPKSKTPAVEQKKKPKEKDLSKKILTEVVKGAATRKFKPEELPWLKEDMEVRLDHATLKDMGAKLYLGTCIARGNPADVAASMHPEQRVNALNSFYTVLPDFVTQHFSAGIKTLTDQRTARRILYTSNAGGQRLYFMETEKINNEPVIIVIGMCDKAQQIPLLVAFTTTEIKDIKRKGKI